MSGGGIPPGKFRARYPIDPGVPVEVLRRNPWFVDERKPDRGSWSCPSCRASVETPDGMHPSGVCRKCARGLGRRA